jgi:hypothetical protein
VLSDVPLNLYVMPLQLYFRGEFEPIISPGSTALPPESCDETSARERQERLASTVSDASSTDASWSDEGDIEFHQSLDPRNLHALRSFAAHQEYPPKLRLFGGRFRVLDDPRDHKSLRKIYDGARTQFEHLMRHSDDRGFYFPTEFASPCPAGETKWWMIGSAPRLREELARIESRFDADTPALVRETCSLLLEAANTACERQLPLIWHGT